MKLDQKKLFSMSEEHITLMDFLEFKMKMGGSELFRTMIVKACVKHRDEFPAVNEAICAIESGAKKKPRRRKHRIFEKVVPEMIDDELGPLGKLFDDE